MFLTQVAKRLLTGWKCLVGSFAWALNYWTHHCVSQAILLRKMQKERLQLETKAREKPWTRAKVGISFSNKSLTITDAFLTLEQRTKSKSTFTIMERVSCWQSLLISDAEGFHRLLYSRSWASRFTRFQKYQRLVPNCTSHPFVWFISLVGVLQIVTLPVRSDWIWTQSLLNTVMPWVSNTNRAFTTFSSKIFLLSLAKDKW